MRRIRIVATLIASLLSAGLALTGCGVQPSSVLDGGRSPTGVAAGTPVYYVDAEGDLVANRRGNQLGTIGQALKMLLSTRPSEMRSYVEPGSVTLELPITRASGVITVMLPIERRDVSRDVGIDQLVCTTLAVHQQAGGSAATRVRLRFVQGTATEPRHCPVLPRG